MKKIIKSSLIVLAVAAIAGYGTYSFFSDTETSTGNTFTAGEIDLTVDSTAHYAGLTCTGGVWVEDSDGQSTRPDLEGDPCSGTWALTDLGPGYQFFNLGDLKPGDEGENTISLHVDSNDAYVCAVINNLQDNDNGLTEPEGDAGDVTGGPIGGGELSNELRFFAWADTGADSDFGDLSDPTEGDNIWQANELPLFSNREGPASDVLGGRSYPLFTPTPGNGPMPAGSTSYIGLYWCYGAIDDSVAGTLTCNGDLVSNVTQTDSISADIHFYVEQARNNPGFTCPTPENINGGDSASVGANFGFYEEPTNCTVTVNSGQSIQAAVNSAADNNTVCVADGTYDEGVTINKPLTLVALNGPSNTAVINGGVRIGASNVTVKGFKVIPGNFPSTYAGFYLDTNNIGNIVISDNDIDGTSQGNTDRGIETLYNGTYGALTITNNKIHGVATGIYENPHTGNVWEITYNDIFDTTAGIGGFNHSHVAYNEFKDNADEAIGTDNSYDGSSRIEFNNFLTGDEVVKYGVWPNPDNGLPTILAENNFWDDDSDTQTIGNVDFTPEAGAAYPHN